MKLIVLDFISPTYIDIDEDENDIFFPITPYAIYLCELFNLNYINIHQVFTQEEFRDNLNDIFYEYKKILEINQEGHGLYYKSLQLLSYFYCLSKITKILYEYKSKDYNIQLITDRTSLLKVDQFNILNNELSLIDKVFLFDSIRRVRRSKVKNNSSIIKYLKKINFKNLKKLYNKFKQINVSYDWILISPKIKAITYQYSFTNESIKIILFNFIRKKFDFEDIVNQVFIKNLEFNVVKAGITSNYFTFLSKDKFHEVMYLKSIDEKIFMFQHGSYYYHYAHTYKSYNLQINEVNNADINFVFNDYTKKLFEELDAKKVYSVGSILFNKPIIERKKKYDFLYITQGHDYIGNFQYVDFPNSLHSFDGYELYQRHKSIIHLFGKKFKDKKIIIVVHPAVVTTGVYVPFWELAEPYDNITIDVNIPIHSLIEKSDHIISDYFTTEFINRELHYKRNIILFQGAPTPLPEQTVEDMKKMFILVDTVDELKEKIENIEEITKNRKRYDDIIEYYSSKKCDTRKIVTEILEKELNGR